MAKGYTHELLEIIEKAREYEKTKSITTATDVCNMLIKWADRATELANADKEG